MIYRVEYHEPYESWYCEPGDEFQTLDGARNRCDNIALNLREVLAGKLLERGYENYRRAMSLRIVTIHEVRNVQTKEQVDMYDDAQR